MFPKSTVIYLHLWWSCWSASHKIGNAPKIVCGSLVILRQISGKFRSNLNPIRINLLHQNMSVWCLEVVVVSGSRQKGKIGLITVCSIGKHVFTLLRYCNTTFLSLHTQKMLLTAPQVKINESQKCTCFQYLLTSTNTCCVDGWQWHNS